MNVNANVKLKLSNVTKSFGERRVIDRLSYELDTSVCRRVALLGPSGCGKSTLLSMIAGSDTNYEGTIDLEPSGIGVSISFQEPRLLPWLTAAENVSLVCGGKDRRNATKRARALLGELGLAGHEDKYPDELSGGMQTRVSIARALSAKAGLYLFDEPFASLDPDTAERCVEVIRRHTEGAGVIAVIHSPELAARFADEVLFFSSTAPTKLERL